MASKSMQEELIEGRKRKSPSVAWREMGKLLGQWVSCILGVRVTGRWWLLCALRCPWPQLAGRGLCLGCG